MSQSSDGESRHKKLCDCGNDEFYFCKDLNLDKAWKAGNKWCRICTDCGNRYFLSQAMYQAATDQYVILNGEDDPQPVFECPACSEQVTGQPGACPYCDVEYDWGPSDETDVDEAAETEDEDEQGDTDDSDTE